MSNEYKKMSKAEMARLMETEKKVLEFKNGAIGREDKELGFVYQWGLLTRVLEKLWNQPCRVKQERKKRPMTSLEVMEFLQDTSDGLGVGNGVVVVKTHEKAIYNYTLVNTNTYDYMENPKWGILKDGKVGEWQDFPMVEDV